MPDFTSTAVANAHRPVHACELHPGDVVQQYDWPLHVRTVTLGPAAVTIAVTEFEFPLHYAAEAEVHVLAPEPGRTVLDEGRSTPG